MRELAPRPSARQVDLTMRLDFIRERLPLMWLIASIWYRGEVRGLGNILESAPCCWSATTLAAT